MKVEREEVVKSITITLEGEEEIEFMHAFAHCSDDEMRRFVGGELSDQEIDLDLLDDFRANLNVELEAICPKLETPGGNRG